MTVGELLELADAHPAVAVQEVEYRRLLGYPKDHELTGRALELSDWARAWYAEHGRPWWYARQAAHVELPGGARVAIEGETFESSRLHEQLAEAGATSAVLVAVGAGSACELQARRLWEDGKPDEYFFLEVFGSAVVEALVAAASFRLCEWADGRGLAVLPHYSPGYPDWHIAEQARLRQLLPLDRAGLAEGVRVLETGMLEPKKSLLAVFGLTPHLERVQRLTSLVPCVNCALVGCRYRRAPYARPMRRLEAVQAAAGESAAANARRAPLTVGARYSVAGDVLKRWARQRLTMQVMDDTSVEARFRYDGTTCSNMGRPLAFEYRMRVGPREGGYVITDLACAPAPGDDGYTFMCEYIADAEGLMREIAAEKPLLGRPLDDVLGWARGRGVAGCYCAAPSREHKWGLALETLHWALANASND